MNEPSLSNSRYKVNSQESFAVYKNRHWRIAKQLGYSKTILRMIENSTSESEITRAMRAGREQMKD